MLLCKDQMNNFRNCVHRDPTKLVRCVVLLICCIVVIVQLTECFLKLRYPPISTHSHYDLNDTMALPALTFCREPPYKAEVLQKYNLADHPKYYSFWRRFPYDTANITEVFEEATFTSEEIIVQYGLSGERDLIEITSNLHFTLGLCHTFRSVKPSKSSSFKSHGYSIMLKHTLTKAEAEELNIEVGWHIYIHEPKENFTEIRMKASGRVEYMFAEVEEDIEIKLQTQHFNMMADTERVCINSPGYSSPKCGELCIWKDITANYQCSGPWMPEINLPACNNFSHMGGLITDYSILYDAEAEPRCICPDPCQSTIYSAFVMNRRPLAQPRPSTQIWAYYTSKLISIIEERPGYDLSQFVADMGGSIGFLLGLSVLGLIEILEKILSLVLLKIVKKGKEPNEPDSTSRSSFADGSSDITVEISTITERSPKSKNKYTY